MVAYQRVHEQGISSGCTVESSGKAPGLLCGKVQPPAQQCGDAFLGERGQPYPMTVRLAEDLGVEYRVCGREVGGLAEHYKDARRGDPPYQVEHEP
jgi:hypothetical protein